MKGLWLPLLAVIVFWCLVIHAAVEKVDDNKYSVTKSTTTTYDFKERKDFIEALKKDVIECDEHKAELQSQIADLEKEIKEAETAEVVDIKE